MKGQFAMEFIMMLAMAILIGMTFLVAAAGVLTDRSEEQRIAALNDVGYALQDEVILATTVSDGYRRTVVVPEQADRFTYTLSAGQTWVTLSSGSTTITYQLPPVTGAFQKGENTIAKDGTVTVSQ